MERTQAFKLMGRLLVIAPQAFPISFARSLVAVANFNKEDVSKEDPFRKVVLPNLITFAVGTFLTLSVFSCRISLAYACCVTWRFAIRVW
jgi:hypothetical protein